MIFSSSGDDPLHGLALLVLPSSETLAVPFERDGNVSDRHSVQCGVYVFQVVVAGACAFFLGYDKPLDRLVPLLLPQLLNHITHDILLDSPRRFTFHHQASWDRL